jgi:hypothetical protein
MGKVFEDDSSLTEDGKRVFLDFNASLAEVMRSDEAHDMSESELLILGTHMHKLIGEAIAKRITQKRVLAVQIDKMNDYEFEAHLRDRYGDTWSIHSLEPEEMDRIPMFRLLALSQDMCSVGQELRKYMKHMGLKVR